MAVQLALMRGINVGGKNRLPMRDLAALFEEAGCSDVRTFIQSGNVIFKPPKKVSRLGEIVAAGIAERYGYRTPVILRTVEQLRDVVKGNPFPGGEERLHVMFLAGPPAHGAYRGARSESLCAGPVHRARRRDLSASAERRGVFRS